MSAILFARIASETSETAPDATQTRSLRDTNTCKRSKTRVKATRGGLVWEFVVLAISMMSSNQMIRSVVVARLHAPLAREQQTFA